MDTFILVLPPWFLGQLLTMFSFGQRLVVYLSKRKGFTKKTAQKSVGRLICDTVFDVFPLLLTVMACLRSITYIVSRYEDILPLYLPILLLFSGLFFYPRAGCGHAGAVKVSPLKAGGRHLVI